MPRDTHDNLPPPGDDSALAEHAAATRSAGPAPMPEPGEQPDPPRGTPPPDSGMSDDEIRQTRFKTVGEVGLFQHDAEVPEHHWSPARLRRLQAEGKVTPAGKREAKP